MTTEAVLFDLDGTLIDTAPDMGGALNRVLKRHHHPEVSEQIYRAQVSHGSIALLRLGFTDLKDSELVHLREEFLTEYEQGIADESHLFNGVEPVLACFENHGIPWGIITNKPEYLTYQLLDALQLTSRCCCIVGADTAARAKPHPDPMILACQRTRVKPGNCIYVGDAERDIQAGNSVDMKSLIAGWGYIDPQHDKPASWGANGWLSTPAQLLDHCSPMLKLTGS